jgi:hypothetical protein
MDTGYTTMRTGNVMTRSHVRPASDRPAPKLVDNRCIR